MKKRYNHKFSNFLLKNWKNLHSKFVKRWVECNNTMNKNEEEQLSKLKCFTKQGRKNKLDIFYGNIGVIKSNVKNYDAIVLFDKYKKYVQITTMSNLVLSRKNKVQHAKRYMESKYNTFLNGDFSDKNIKKNMKIFKGSGVERKITKSDEKIIHISNKISNNDKQEINLDEKYGINSSHLTNALFRSIMKKVKKYEVSNKKSKSVLVIIDESNNVFYETRVVNFSAFSESEKARLKKWDMEKYFHYILQVVINETNFNKNKFFDEIQVYFKEAKSSNSKGKYYISNNIISSDINLKEDKRAMEQIAPVSMNISFNVISRS